MKILMMNPLKSGQNQTEGARLKLMFSWEVKEVSDQVLLLIEQRQQDNCYLSIARELESPIFKQRLKVQLLLKRSPDIPHADQPR